VLPYPLIGGAKIRAYYVLRHLSRRHQITLVSFIRPDDDQEAISHLAQFCESVQVVPMERSRFKDAAAIVESLASGLPAVIIRDRLRPMEIKLANLVQEQCFDLVHADQTSMAQYALYAHAIAGIGEKPVTVLDQHNALYLLVQRQSLYESSLTRPIWRREARLLAAYERELCRRFDALVTVTDEDKQALMDLLPGEEAEQLNGRISAIPICVDTGTQQPLSREREGRQIVHLGTMFWPPNIEGVMWFGEEVLPLIWQEMPDVRFIVAGKRPPKEVLALGKSKNGKGGAVVVTGYVENPQPLLEQSQVFVVPVRAGGGMRVKIIDAWCWGMPVVSTTIGAEGLRVNDGENILLADEPEEFARAVVQLLRDQAMACAIGEAGRRWVEKYYEYRNVYVQFDAVYARAAGKPGI